MLGAQLAHYKLSAKLGEGGMGEVYRATDTRLGRDVALKILPEAFMASPERCARFEREARVLASLTHPNIAAIYDVGQAEGVHYLAMELAEGETLQARLRQGVPSRQDMLDIARQVAEALEAAHAKGVVHRDLKPANIMLDAEGRAKLLDFGLAKALVGDADGISDPSISHSPTMTVQPTAAGVILGTAAYMSPEQARGKAVDARTDIWSFGLILYETLTGDSPFHGDTVTDTLAAVLRADLDWSALPPGTPASLRNLLRRCLERDAAKRMHSIADARIVLEEIAEAGDAAWIQEAPAEPARRRILPWVAGFALGAVAASALLLSLSPTPTTTEPASAAAPSMEFRPLTQLPGGESDPVLAPDGQSFAYTKSVGGQIDIFLQRTDGQNAINLTSSCEQDDTEPAFSADGRYIAYQSDCGGGGVFVMGSTGESVRRVTEFGFSPAWSPDGTELAVVTEQPGLPSGRISQSTLWAVTVQTGERRLISEHDAMHPAWSPDGKRIAFWGLPEDSNRRDLFTVLADGSRSAIEDAVHVIDDEFLDWSPIWANGGRSLIFASTRGGTMNLWKLPMDPSTGNAAGPPTPLPAPSGWAGWPSVSADGRQFIFVDRNAREAVYRVPLESSGRFAGPPEPFPVGSFEIGGGLMDIMADGKSVAFASSDMPQHLYIVTIDGTLRQLTEGFHRDRQPSWSPDGTWIAFQSDRFPEGNLALIRTDGGGLRHVEEVTDSIWNPCWSPDGSHLAFTCRQGGRIMAMEPGGGGGGEVEILPSPGDGLNFDPRSFSLDGKLLAGVLSSPAGMKGLAVLDRVSGSYRYQIDRVPSTNASVLFAADGQHLVLAEESRLVRHNLTTGTSEVLFASHPDRTIRSVGTSPDRRWLVFIVSADESDIWLGSLGD